jgi:hypothetical protein
MWDPPNTKPQTTNHGEIKKNSHLLQSKSVLEYNLTTTHYSFGGWRMINVTIELEPYDLDYVELL